MDQLPFAFVVLVIRLFELQLSAVVLPRLLNAARVLRLEKELKAGSVEAAVAGIMEVSSKPFMGFIKPFMDSIKPSMVVIASSGAAVRIY